MENRKLHDKVVSGHDIMMSTNSTASINLESPSPLQTKAKIKAAVTNKKSKNSKQEPHVYSSTDLHHIHNVHIDSKVIAHDGMLSGDTEGDAFEGYEIEVMRKVGHWGSHARKKDWGEEEFNLDTYQF